MKYLSIILISVSVLLAGTSCAATDVVARYASRSFADASSRLITEQTAQSLAITNEHDVRFELFFDVSTQTDALLSLPAGSFIEAGLDAHKLPAGDTSRWTIEGERLVGRFNLADGGRAASDTAASLIDAIARQARHRIAYHAQGKHYGIMLDEVAMIEWAARMDENDKDWIIVLDPGAISAAGADPHKVAGWTMALITVDGPDDTMVQVEKLLQSVDLPR